MWLHRFPTTDKNVKQEKKNQQNDFVMQEIYLLLDKMVCALVNDVPFCIAVNSNNANVVLAATKWETESLASERKVNQHMMCFKSF